MCQNRLYEKSEKFLESWFAPKNNLNCKPVQLGQRVNFIFFIFKQRIECRGGVEPEISPSIKN